MHVTAEVEQRCREIELRAESAGFKRVWGRSSAPVEAAARDAIPTCAPRHTGAQLDRQMLTAAEGRSVAFLFWHSLLALLFPS